MMKLLQESRQKDEKIQQLSSEINQLQCEAKENNDKINQLQRETNENNDIKNQLQCEAKENNDKISQPQFETKENNDKINQLQREASEYCDQISQLQCEVKENNNKINQLQRDVIEKDNKIEHLIKEVHQNIKEAVEANEGRYDYLSGKATVRLKSRNQAEGFWKVLSNTKYIFELDIEMGWNHTESDLTALEKVLNDSSASTLQLNIKQFETTDNAITTNTHHDIILNNLRNPKLKTVNITLSLDFIGCSTPIFTPSL
jgi:chromosome segregation ATPase